MEDALIGFEVAKLAKEKGFDEDTYECYSKDKYLIDCSSDEHVSFKYDLKCRAPENCYSAPTQSLLQRWLREEHGLIISIVPTFTYALTTNVGYYAHIEKVNKETNSLNYLYLDIYFSATYEESLERGLLEALKLI